MSPKNIQKSIEFYKNDPTLQNRNKVISDCKYFIRYLLFRKKVPTKFYRDIMQESVIYLIKAIENYNPEKGKFSTYLDYWIFLCIEKFAGKMPKKEKNFTDLEEKISDHNEYIDPIEKAIQQEEIDFVIQQISTLNDKQREILYHRYGLQGKKEKGLIETAKAMNLTREKIRQIECKSIRLLKEKINAKNIPISSLLE